MVKVGQCWDYNNQFYEIKKVFRNWVKVVYFDYSKELKHDYILINNIKRGSLMPF